MHQPSQPSEAPRSGAPEQAEPAAADGQHVMDLLHEHVPLTLLADLAELPVDADGHATGSRAILRAEGEPEHAWWEPPAAATDGSPAER